MIGWILVLLGSYFLIASSNVMDKVLIGRYIKNSYALLVLNNAMALVIALAMIALRPSVLHASNIPIFVAVGIMQIIGAALYYVAIVKTEISRVILLYNFIPVFSLILAFVFLGESLSPVELLAFVLILIAGFILSVKRAFGTLRIDQNFWLIMISSVIYAASYVVLKYGLYSVDFYSAQVFVEIGAAAGAFLVLLYSISAKKARASDFVYKKAAIGISFIDELLYVVGRLAFNIALIVAPVALATALGGIQGLFVFAITIFLSVYFPKVLKEKTDISSIMVKAIALLLMIAGIAILAYA